MPARSPLLRRLTADPLTLDAEELQLDVERLSAESIHRVRRGEVATVCGRVRSVIYTPRETVPTFEAQLFDGFEAIDLVWLGRRRIAGVEPGRLLVARGRIGDHDGNPAVYNPWYRLRDTQ